MNLSALALEAQVRVMPSQGAVFGGKAYLEHCRL